MRQTFSYIFRVLQRTLGVKYMMLFLIAMIVYEAAQIGVSYIPSLAIYIFKNDLPANWITAFFVGISVFFGFIIYLDTELDMKIWTKNVDLVCHDLTIALYDKLASLDDEWHQNNDSGALITKVAKGIGRFVEITNMLSWDFIPSIIQLVLSVTVLTILSPLTLPVIAVYCSLFVYITHTGHNSVKRLRDRIHNLEEQVGSSFVEDLQGLRDIRSSSCATKFAQMFKERHGILLKLHVDDAEKTIRQTGQKRLALTYITYALILGVLFMYLKNDQINGEIFFGNMTIVGRLTSSMNRFIRLYDQFEKNGESIRRIASLEQENTNIKGGQLKQIPQGDIVINDVSFRYKTSTKYSLNGVSLIIKSGKTVAFVGESGSGKSTLVKVIARLFDVTQGQVLIGGVDLRDFDLDNLNQSFVTVPQDPFVYNNSARQNIAMMNDASDDQIIHAMREASIYDLFMNDQGSGLDTLVGEKGVKLSGGQKQRLNLARAILRIKMLLEVGIVPYVILDEPTSALDSKTEIEIMNSIHLLQSMGATVIIIAHRLSTIKNADKIIVLQKGQIAEIGNHNELINFGGLYYELVKAQELESH